jgi:GWxTD domain-containing protein
LCKFEKLRTFINIFFCLLLLSLCNCSARKKPGPVKVVKAEAADAAANEINAVAYHLNDSMTRIYLQIRNDNLLYKRPDTSKAFYAEVKVRFLLNPLNAPKQVSDSGSFFMLDRSAGEYALTRPPLYANFEVSAKIKNDYLLQVEVADWGRKTSSTEELKIYKQNRFTAQNFLITLNDSMVFRNTFLKDEQVVVQVADNAVKQVTVDCFFHEFGPALPPFSTKAPDEFKYKPDSSFVIPYITQKFMLQMPARGFYHIKADPGSFQGKTLYTVDETFPGVSNSAEMIQCTRYIMFREEFENCRDAVDKKAAIDQFWLNIGGSLERARELLKRYYGRVKEANKNYTSYTQGWKSDRGMIYIVMGPPAALIKNPKEEVWVYGNEANPNALRFVFRKTENPFSDNDYVMERSAFYKEAYHTAVEYWRQGLIYSDGKR